MNKKELTEHVLDIKRNLLTARHDEAYHRKLMEYEQESIKAYEKYLKG